MNKVIAILNQKAHYFFGTEISHLIPFDIKTDSVTVCPDKEHQSIIQTPLKNSAVWRAVIGYTMCEKMSQDDTFFIFTLSNLLNEGLKDLSNHIGDLKGRKIYLERPGNSKVYFRDLENIPALEIRLFVGKIDA